MTVQLNLMVNDAPIKTDYFVSGFIDHTVSGMIESLEGTGQIKNLELVIDGGALTINLNGADIPVNAFVTLIFKGTISGMVSTLKGVNEINKVKITISK
jgi:hypothetical protein